jgi:DNA-binding transcriptional MocR family regulator
VQTDLVQGNVNPETRQKQDRILSRLLDASRSTRERDYEQRRRSEAGKLVQHPSPAQIDLTTQEGKNRLREELMKVLESRYSKDYEELIRKYFEELEKEDAGNH